MKNLIYLNLLGLITLMSAACSSTRVYSDKAEGVDFTRFHTYAWLPVIDTAAGSIYYNEIVEQNLVEKIDKEMSLRNFAIRVNDPELLILLHVRLDQEQEAYEQTYPEEQVITTHPRGKVITSYPLYSTYPYYYYGFAPYLERPFYYWDYNTVETVYGTEIDTIEYTTGTIVIDVIRKDDNKLVWRGWSEERIDTNTTSEELEQIVDNIFKKFPIKEPENAAPVNDIYGKK